MGNKSGKQKVTKKGKNDEQPNEKPEEKPENGPTATTEKVDDKTEDTGAAENVVEKDGAEGDGGGGGTDEPPKDDVDKQDTEVGEPPKDDTPQTDEVETEKPTEQPSEPSGDLTTNTDTSDNIVKDNVETEPPTTDGGDSSETRPPTIGDDVPPPTSGGDNIVDDSSSPVIKDEPTTEAAVNGVEDDKGEVTEETVPSGEPVSDVLVEVTPPPPVTENDTDAPTPEKTETTDPEPDKPETNETPSGENIDESVTKYSTEFKWEEAGTTVFVAGSFNDWKENIPLEKIEEVFTTKIDLAPGEYLYKFIVDDEWVVNKKQDVKMDDEGKENNVIVVESAG